MSKSRGVLSSLSAAGSYAERNRDSTSGKHSSRYDSIRSSTGGSSSESRGIGLSRGMPSYTEGSAALDLAIKPYILPRGEEVIDIDISEIGNANHCLEYVDEVYTYLKGLEKEHCIIPNYLTKQPHLSVAHREFCVDFQVQLHRSVSIAFEQSLQLDTLFLAVSLLDRFLARRTITQERTHLLSLGCFYVACKFEETYYPSVDQLLKFVPSAGKKDDILAMEKIILNELRYKLGAPTAVTFLKRYAKAALADSNLGMLARFICEYSLMSYAIIISHPPSIVAAASIANGLRILNRPPWNATLQYYTGYTYDQLRPCMAEQRDAVRRAPAMKLQTIYKKYADGRYLKAAVTAVAKI